MLVGGLVALGATVVELAGGAIIVGPSFRDGLASSTAIALVGLIGWGVHWRYAQTQALKDPGERASLLRRCYLYAVLVILMMMAGAAATHAAEGVFALAEGKRLDGVDLARNVWMAALFAGVWRYHLGVVGSDRALVGERGGAATLRRWYTYGVRFIAMTVALIASRDLLVTLVDAVGGLGRLNVAHDAALAFVWVGVWSGQILWPRVAHRDDRDSTLQAVEAFLMVGLSVVLVLSEANQTLYYLIARLLGVQAPGGVLTFDLAVIARPLCTVAVFGAAWGLTRQRLAGASADGEPGRQASVRRLYEHLVALVAVLALGGGLAGLFWSLSDMAFEIAQPQRDGAVDRVSLFLSLILIAAPVWLLHWHSQTPPGGTRTLGRRLYLFGTLAACVVALLASGAALVTELVKGVLGADLARLPGQIGRPLSFVLAGASLGVYHWRILQADGLRRSEDGLQEAPDVQGEVGAGVTLIVSIQGAEDAEVRAALASLPAGAHYTVRREA